MRLSKNYFSLVVVAIVAYLVSVSCGVSYKLNNAKLDYSLYKTISIADFLNQAPLVYPPLFQEFNEKLKDVYARQTRLQVVTQNGDYNLEGAIVGYDLQQLAVGSDGLSAQTRLVMRVRVKFYNNKNHQEDFEREFSAQKEFSSSTSFESVQAQLVTQLVDEIIDQIFNATVASW